MATELMGLDYEQANAKQRAGSVQPGMLVPQYLEMHFPINWNPDQVIGFINKFSPCQLSSLTGPKRMQLDGVDVDLYGVTLQDDISRNAHGLKQTLMKNLMVDAKDDDMPQKLRDRYSKPKEGKNKLKKHSKDEEGDETMSRHSASPARSASSASSNEDKPRDKSPEIYREVQKAKLTDKDSYGGRVHKSPHQVDLEAMDQKQLIDYCHAWHAIAEKLGDFGQSFPHTKLKDSAMWGMDLDIFEKAMHEYLHTEKEELMKLPKGLTQDMMDAAKLQLLLMKANRRSRGFKRSHEQSASNSSGQPNVDRNFPIGDQDKPRTWQVLPNVTRMRDDYATVADIHSLDGSTAGRICALNNRNMNIS